MVFPLWLYHDEAPDLSVGLFAILDNADSRGTGGGSCSCILDVEHGKYLGFSADPGAIFLWTYSASCEKPVLVVYQVVTSWDISCYDWKCLDCYAYLDPSTLHRQKSLLFWLQTPLRHRLSRTVQQRRHLRPLR